MPSEAVIYPAPPPAGDRTTTRMAAIFKVLSDPTRLRIVRTLERNELCVQDIASAAGLSQSLVSHHLQTLRRSNMVGVRRAGRLAYYHLADSHVLALVAIARDHSQESNPLNER